MISLSWLSIVDSVEKKASRSLAVKASKVLLSYLTWEYFSFLVFFISNYYYSGSIFSPSPAALAGSFFYSFFSFFLGTLVSSNHSSTREHSSKTTRPSSVYFILNDTPKVSSLGFWGLVTKYPICLLKPLTAGSYSISISIAYFLANLTVLLVGILAPAS